MEPDRTCREATNAMLGGEELTSSAPEEQVELQGLGNSNFQDSPYPRPPLEPSVAAHSTAQKREKCQKGYTVTDLDRPCPWDDRPMSELRPTHFLCILTDLIRRYTALHFAFYFAQLIYLHSYRVAV